MADMDEKRLADRLESAINGLGKHGILGIAPVMREAVEFIRARAALPDRPQAEGVRVKQLEWTLDHDGWWHAECAGFVREIRSHGRTEAEIDTLKKGAQGDFERHIRSGLSASAAPADIDHAADRSGAPAAGVTEAMVDGKALIAEAKQQLVIAYRGGSYKSKINMAMHRLTAAERALDAALSHRAQEADGGWRPIATAPKDGSKFDVWVPDAFGGHRMTDLSFNSKGQLRQHGLLTPAERPRWPTHWMPSRLSEAQIRWLKWVRDAGGVTDVTDHRTARPVHEQGLVTFCSHDNSYSITDAGRRLLEQEEGR
jgi:hypothetical protein